MSRTLAGREPTVEFRRRGRSLRIRLTLVYCGLFLLCGVILLGITYLLFEQVTAPVAKGGSPTNQYPLGQHPDPGLGNGSGLTRDAVLQHLLADSAIALGIVTVIALVLGWFVAGRILRPLRTITATVRRISATNLHETLALGGTNDELKELGDTFDELLERLQRSWELQRQFIANVSHELRSLVTRPRLQAEIAATNSHATVESLQAGYSTIVDTAQAQEGLIAALLTLAKGQRGLDHAHSVDLASLARHILDKQQASAQPRGLYLTTDISPATVDGDSRLVEQLIGNLIDNAVIHNIDGGDIHLSTTTDVGRGILVVEATIEAAFWRHPSPSGVIPPLSRCQSHRRPGKAA